MYVVCARPPPSPPPLQSSPHGSEPEFVNVYGAPESIPPANVAWRAGGTANKVILPARQATQAGGINSWAPSNVYKFVLWWNL